MIPPRKPPPLSIPTPPSAWRGAGAAHRPPAPSPRLPILRKPCGLCNRVRAWVGLGPRR
jgi:hypothetical protein